MRNNRNIIVNMY